MNMKFKRLLMYMVLGWAMSMNANAQETSATRAFMLSNALSVAQRNASVVVAREMLKIGDAQTVIGVQIKKGHELWDLPFQLDDLNEDAQWDELFFQVNASASETMQVVLLLGNEPVEPVESRVYAGIKHDELVDRLILESELSLYTMYGSTTMDCVGKLYPMLVHEELYDKRGNQHQFSITYGHDYLAVGNTMGAHASFIAKQGKIYRPWTDRSFFVDGPIAQPAKIESRILYNGPLRCAIETTVSGVPTDDGLMGYKLIFAISSKQRHVNVTVHPGEEMIQKGYAYGAGFRHFYEDIHVTHTHHFISRVAADIWESGVLQQRVARAIITPLDTPEVRSIPDNPEIPHALKTGPNTGVVFSTLSSEPIRYAFLSAWEKDNGYTSQEQWLSGLNKLVQELKHPLRVELVK
jgi:hypothetical protein